MDTLVGALIEGALEIAFWFLPSTGRGLLALLLLALVVGGVVYLFVA